MTERTDRFTPEFLVRRFLRGSTGCGFASDLAAKRDGMLWAISPGMPGENHAEDANTFLVSAAKQSKVGVLVYPSMRSASDVAALLLLLVRDARWHLTERPWRDVPYDDVLVWMRWRTDSGEQSSVMGLAPFGSMPAHRRAAYVSLVVWPGGRENPHHDAPGKTLGFLDVKLPGDLCDETKYRSVMETTRQDVAEISAHAGERAARHDVTFCLPAAVRALLFPLGSTT